MWKGCFIHQLFWYRSPAFTGLVMSDHSLLPKGENLRRAVQWMSDQHCHDKKTIEEAAKRFDLTPLEEEFLLKHCLQANDSKQGSKS
jgi:hypothetical protein